MPLLGYFLGSRFSMAIKAYDHWVAFILLALIGAGMIKESLEKDAECANASWMCGKWSCSPWQPASMPWP